MHNKILFGTIGLLMLAIVGVGLYAISNSSQAVAVSPASSVPAQNIPATSSGTSTANSSPTATPGTYTLAQIAQHNSSSSCYTTISGSVYDLTSFVNQHPGGAQAILSLCGVDGTSAFMAQHGGQGRPERELASLKIGTLAN